MGLDHKKLSEDAAHNNGGWWEGHYIWSIATKSFFIFTVTFTTDTQRSLLDKPLTFSKFFFHNFCSFLYAVHSPNLYTFLFTHTQFSLDLHYEKIDAEINLFFIC